MPYFQDSYLLTNITSEAVLMWIEFKTFSVSYTAKETEINNLPVLSKKVKLASRKPKLLTYLMFLRIFNHNSK